MASDTSSSKSRGAIAALIDALHPDAKGIISVFIVFLAFGVTVYGFVQIPAVIKNFASLSSKEQCWEFREIQSAIWKFNRCTGDATQLYPAEEKKQNPT